MAVQDYKINYKSDFVLTINGDAGWATQFCIKFWTGMPSQAYFVGFDGVKYINCRVGDTPTQLLVMFDDHHLPIGKLKMQIAYHTTIEEFPGSVFDEVTNARDVIVTIDGTDYQVMLDFTGEDAPELEFDLPAYANEAERIQNELQRQQNEADRIAAELQREQATAAAVQGAENVNAQLNGTTLTVTNRQGVSTSVNTKGEPGAQGPVGPEGQQGEQGPKGEKGDTGATGPQGIQGPAGPQGQTGVSITDFVKTGETETDTLYDIEFSNDTTKPVAIPKGEKGDQGEQGPEGPQGPMGDVAVITPEQQAAFTMYSEPGQNTNGPMTQKAVTDALGNVAASGVSYDNSQSGLNATDVQGALDKVSDELYNATSLDVSYGRDYSWILGAITGEGKAQNSSSYYHINIPVSGGMLVGIKANAERLTQYAFLKDINFSYTNNPGTDISSHYCDGYNGVINIEAGESSVFTVPEDCNYLYIMCGQTSGYVHVPESVVVFSSLKEDFLELSDELEQLQEKVDGIILKTINTLSLQSVQAFMTPTNGGTWYTSASTNKGKFIPVTAGEKYIITAAEQYSYFAFLTSNVYGSNNTPVTTFATDEYCHFERSGSVTNITAPSDAEYLFISVLNGTVDCTPIVQLQRDVSQELDNMQEKQDMLLSDVGEITYDLNVFPLQACLNAITYWAGSTNRSIFIPIRGSQVFRITANDSYPSIVSFHTSNVWSTANSTRTINNYAHGEYTRHDLAKGCTHILISPSDAKYMCVYIKSNDSTIYAPNEIVKLDVSNASVITQKLEASKLASINACRNAHVVSQSKYIYTFAIDSLILKDNEFIVNYNASETDTDADTIAEVVNADHCLDKVSILNFSTVNGSEPSYTIEKTDSTVIQGFVGWTARVLVNNNICVLGVCRQTNKNPFYVYAILEGDEESFVYKECKLKYTPTGGSQTTVDFTVNNYRQMLVDCGFASSYLASQGEAADNCNLCYENGIYYIFTATSPSSALPLMCLKSIDLETWEVVGVVLSNNMRINEISAVVKNGIGYIMYRTTTDWSRACFAIYDIANNTLINSGVFHDAVESRADVFTFEGDVYLAYNVLPSTYKSTTSLVRPDQGGRNEINVYKVVDNNPIFFRRICNPTGLNYFRFQETPVYVDSMNTWWNQGAIYLAYSEDRRHLYRRQFANISIADVTAVFADSGRIV